MRTYHLPNLPKGAWSFKGRKIQLAHVTRHANESGETIPTSEATTTYREALRIRVNSRTARKLRRAGAELAKP